VIIEDKIVFSFHLKGLELGVPTEEVNARLMAAYRFINSNGGEIDDTSSIEDEVPVDQNQTLIETIKERCQDIEKTTRLPRKIDFPENFKCFIKTGSDILYATYKNKKWVSDITGATYDNLNQLTYHEHSTTKRNVWHYWYFIDANDGKTKKLNKLRISE
jgi:hypothetical protein